MRSWRGLKRVDLLSVSMLLLQVERTLRRWLSCLSRLMCNWNSWAGTEGFGSAMTDDPEGFTSIFYASSSRERSIIWEGHFWCHLREPWGRVLVKVASKKSELVIASWESGAFA